MATLGDTPLVWRLCRCWVPILRRLRNLKRSRLQQWGLLWGTHGSRRGTGCLFWCAQEGNTPLHYAVQAETGDRTKCVGELLRLGANPLARNKARGRGIVNVCLVVCRPPPSNENLRHA